MGSEAALLFQAHLMHFHDGGLTRFCSEPAAKIKYAVYSTCTKTSELQKHVLKHYWAILV